jgi:hypothetical protein
MICVETWQSSFAEYLKHLNPDGLSGKMSLESCQATKDAPLAPSSGKWRNAGMVSPTESWTLNISESPKDAAGSTPSAILATGENLSPLYLSRVACVGILRRAKNMGRAYSKRLTTILETQKL